MRVLPLVIILALIGAVGYVYFFHWDFVSRKVRGYAPATTPDEAMNYFEKAIKERDYKTASLYCTGDYSEYLRKSDDAARRVGRLMDRIMYYMKEQGLQRPTTVSALYFFDAFPPYFSQKGAPTKNPKDDNTATGVIELDTIELDPLFIAKDENINRNMFSTILTPWVFLQPTFPGKQVAIPLKQVDEGGSKSWKLDIPLPPDRAAAINYYLDNYKAYETGFNQFSTFLTSERMASKQEMEGQVMKIFRDAKE